MKKLIAAAGALAVVAGCATRPEKIEPSFVSNEPYMASECAQLAERMSDAKARLQDFSAKQEKKANVDAAFVFWVLVPASLFTGDYAADVAKSKGEVAAIGAAQASKGCTAIKA